MTVYFLLYMAIGRLLIYLGMKFPPLAESKYEFIKKLFSCDECLGVWVYTGLSFVMGMVLFKTVFYVPVISEIITGGVSSFIMHLLKLGWTSKFEILIVEK